MEQEAMEKMAKEIAEQEEKVKEKENSLPLTTMSENKIRDITEPTSFAKAFDERKLDILKQASVEDKSYVEDVKRELKKASLKSAELEKDKQELEQKHVKLNQEVINTRQDLEEQKQNSNKWANKEERRQFHYNGVKAIMQFVGIKEPMCLPLLYMLTFLITPFFLVWKFFKGTIGVIFTGEDSSNRKDAVKKYLWSLLGFVLTVIIICGIIIGGVWLIKWGKTW